FLTSADNSSPNLPSYSTGRLSNLCRLGWFLSLEIVSAPGRDSGSRSASQQPLRES
ncbi:unnamed protein product, partial [Closterium sp. Naga37s-1]